MSFIKNQNRTLPVIAALAAFAAVSMLYFAPQFSGKEIKTNDVTQYRGMSQEITEHQLEYGEDPQWTGAMFGGMPAPLIKMTLDAPVWRYIDKTVEFMGRPASMIFLAMTAFFIMLLMFGGNPWIGIIPSLAYGLSSYFFLIIGAGHITKMAALAYAPLMVGSVAYTFRKNIWLGASLTAFFAALELFANHPQITYYFLFILLAYWINEGVTAFREKTLPRFAKITGVLAVAGIMAVGANSARLWFTNEAGKESMRGGSELSVGEKTDTDGKKQRKGLDIDYATAWSYGKMESFNMFIPNLTGGMSEGGFSDDGQVAESLRKYNAKDIAKYLPGYWGTQPVTGGPTYLGAVVIFMCVLGLFLLRGRCKWWVLAVTALALMLAWGRNFMWFTELFFNYFPGYNKFRTVAMILVIAEWSVPFIAALILNKLWNSEITKEELIGGVKKALYVTGGTALFFLLAGGFIFDFSSPSDIRYGLPQDVISAMEAERASMLRADSVRSLVFVLLTAGTIWLFAAGKLKKTWLAIALAVLVCADLIPVNLRYLPQSKFVEKSQTAITPSQANLQIMEDKTPGFRVLNMTVDPFNDATTSYFHRSVGGYHGAKMQRYQDIIDRYLSKGNMEVIDMLNTKYLIVPDETAGRPEARLNPGANGAAWLVPDIKIADNARQEIDALASLDTKTEAVADKRFADIITKTHFETDSAAYIRLTEYRSNYLEYEYSANTESAAVFSEIYSAKGWKAYIDGNEAPHFRADYILRGMILPAGKHTVEFRYRAEGFGGIYAATKIFSAIILISVTVSAAFAISRKRKNRIEDGERQETEA